jgi:hypothetical protein
VAIDDGLEENIGLVVFGRETKIAVQLTNDYSKLRLAVGKKRIAQIIVK